MLLRGAVIALFLSTSAVLPQVPVPGSSSPGFGDYKVMQQSASLPDAKGEYSVSRSCPDELVALGGGGVIDAGTGYLTASMPTILGSRATGWRAQFAPASKSPKDRELKVSLAVICARVP